MDSYQFLAPCRKLHSGLISLHEFLCNKTIAWTLCGYVNLIFGSYTITNCMDTSMCPVVRFCITMLLGTQFTTCMQSMIVIVHRYIIILLWKTSYMTFLPWGRGWEDAWKEEVWEYNYIHVLITKSPGFLPFMYSALWDVWCGHDTSTTSSGAEVPCGYHKNPLVFSPHPPSTPHPPAEQEEVT